MQMVLQKKRLGTNFDNFDPEEALEAAVSKKINADSSATHALLIRFKMILNILIILTTHYELSQNHLPK